MLASLAFYRFSSTRLINSIKHERLYKSSMYQLSRKQNPTINTHADTSSGTSGLNFGLRLYLYPYFVYASSVCSGVMRICSGSPEPSSLDIPISAKSRVLAGKTGYNATHYPTNI